MQGKQNNHACKTADVIFEALTETLSLRLTYRIGDLAEGVGSSGHSILCLKLASTHIRGTSILSLIGLCVSIPFKPPQ